MKYIIDKSQHPVYLQIYKYLRDDIISKIYPFGSKLPSKRLLASELSVSTITVEHAYALLCDEGYIDSHERSGYFVIFKPTDGFAVSTHIKAVQKAPQPVFSQPTHFSVDILSKTMRKVLTDYGESILEKSPNSGIEPLREAIGSYLLRNRGISVSPEQIIIGSGGEYLYGLIINLFGKEKTYAIESPSYDKIEQIYRISGVTYESLPLASDGIETSALSNSQADILHITPYRSVPSYVTASASKRHEYLSWSVKNNRFIIESDYGSEFSISSQPMETLFSLSKNDNVIYLNTFSQTISPSLRIGYMVLPKRLTKLFYDKLGFYSCSVPTFEQLVLTELINSGTFERHINKVRRNKRKTIADNPQGLK